MRAPGWLRIELVLLVVAAVAAAVAWQHRSPVVSEPARPGAAAPAPAPVQPKKRPHHESPLPPEANARALKLCLDMAKSQLEFQTKGQLSLEAHDMYGVGDLDTGAGDSIIVEGTARNERSVEIPFRCAMTNLGAYAGSPFITHGPLP